MLFCKPEDLIFFSANNSPCFLLLIIFFNTPKSVNDPVFPYFINRVIQAFFLFRGSFSRLINISYSNPFIWFGKLFAILPRRLVIPDCLENSRCLFFSEKTAEFYAMDPDALLRCLSSRSRGPLLPHRYRIHFFLHSSLSLA